ISEFLRMFSAGFSEMRNELQSQDALWRRIQLEYQQMHAELQKIRDYKDMQEMYQLENKNTKLLLLAQSQENQQEELNEIRNCVYEEEQSHHSEKERMKTEISDLTEELHQDITIATIMEKASLLERQLKTELEIKDKLLAKHQVCKQAKPSIDLCNKQHGNFTTSIHKPEHENVRLQSSLVKLQNDTKTSLLHRYLLLFTNHHFLFIAQSSPEMSFLATAEKFLQEEEKHTREFEERLNLHLEELQRHSENTIQRYARLQQSRHT
uniref:CEP63/Deup1 CEP152 binding coiled coil domain-containing protein n=1 Tax=Amazona collaria TaxID=241587 RepID=A0A8B9F9U0_9PSIT